MFRFILLAVGLSCVHAQQPTIDPILLIDVFGTPPPTTHTTPPKGTLGLQSTKSTIDANMLTSQFRPRLTTPSTAHVKGLEDITVKPTQGTFTNINEKGVPCKCVPYNLCDANLIAVNVNNTTITGWGALDIRFGEPEQPGKLSRKPICQESVELCCVAPSDRARPKPDPTKLKGCGYRNPKGLGAYVIGYGHESQFGEYPWVVALINNLDGSFVGGGVIIHPQVVMTGAHVAYSFGPGTLKIRAGEWDTQTLKEIFEFQERTVQDVYYRNDFQNQSLVNDIALLRLEKPLQLTEHINALCLPTADESFEGAKNCVANGWGKDKFGLTERYAVILKKVELDMVPHDRCQALLQRTRLGPYFQLHRSFVCAGGDGKDTCQGDGGAPLACPIGDERYKLGGLVAWGIGCRTIDVPGVYTNVAAFRPWVDAKMRDWGFGTDAYTI